MAPRGRPPGRKNGAGNPQTATPTPTPTATASAKKTAKKKLGATPKGSSRPAAAAQAIHVAATTTAPPVASPVPVPVADDEPEASISMDKDVTELANGAAPHVRELSTLPDDSAAADDISVVAAEAPQASAPALQPAGRTKLVNGSAGRASGAGASKHGSLGYTASNVDLDVISFRQLTEDIEAYHIDLDFCNSQLAQHNLTPQETRTLQLRRLDLSHQIRFSRHRKEMLEAQRTLKGGRPLARTVPFTPRGPGGPGAANGQGKRLAPGSAPLKRKMSVAAGMEHGNGSASVPSKRARAASEVSIQDTISLHSNSTTPSGEGAHLDDATRDADGSDPDTTNADNTNGYVGLFAKSEDEDSRVHVQRLGFWKCRLCVSEKYLYAGPDRLPNAPSKWPLKDVGKLMSHYFDLHTEHEPEERCIELGDALDNNRGPFEHWLKKSRQQKIPDRSIIDEMILVLQSGRVPQLLRDLCRAAAAFPGA